MTVAYLRSNVESMQQKLLKMSGYFTIGRAKVQEVSLCLLDINISRKHCVFSYNSVDQNWTVTDYSSNGVTVNGIRVQKYVAFALADGDQIILADQNLYSWTFQVPLTPISNNAAAVKGKVMVMDEDNQEVAEGDNQEVAEGDTEGDNQEVARAEGGKEEEDRANQFMAIQTGEDNQSFIKLQVEREKHGAKNAWMYKDEAMYLEMKAQQMALPSMEQQAALPYKPGNVDTWTYQNINSVFHNPDGLELTEVEKIEKAKNEKKEVDQRKGLAAGKDLVKPETPSVKNPPDIHSKIYQRIKIIESQHLAAARARMSARTEAAAEKRRESIAKATDAVAVEQKRKEYKEALKNAKIKRKNSFIALRASILRKSNTKKLNI